MFRFDGGTALYFALRWRFSPLVETTATVGAKANTGRMMGWCCSSYSYWIRNYPVPVGLLFGGNDFMEL